MPPKCDVRTDSSRRRNTARLIAARKRLQQWVDREALGGAGTDGVLAHRRNLPSRPVHFGVLRRCEAPGIGGTSHRLSNWRLRRERCRVCALAYIAAGREKARRGHGWQSGKSFRCARNVCPARRRARVSDRRPLPAPGATACTAASDSADAAFRTRGTGVSDKSHARSDWPYPDARRERRALSIQRARRGLRAIDRYRDARPCSIWATVRTRAMRGKIRTMNCSWLSRSGDVHASRAITTL